LNFVIFSIILYSALGQPGHTPFLVRYHGITNSQCSTIWNDALSDLKAEGCLDVLPTPETSYLDEAPPGGYHAVEVKPTFWWLSEGAYGTLLHIPTDTDKQTILIDCPPTHGTKLREKVAELLGDRDLDVLIYSHFHGDHIGGSHYIVEQWPEVHIVAHRDTKWELEISELSDSPLDIPLPAQVFNSRLTVGPYSLIDANAAHSPGNTYIYAQCEKILMIVDIIFPGWVPYYSWAMTQNFGRYLQAHDEIIAYDFDVLIGGHLTRPGTKADAILQKQYFDDLREAVEKAEKSVDMNDVYAEVVALTGESGLTNPWLVFDTFLEKTGQLCFNEMVDKYKGILGAVDIVTQTHCYTMSEFLSIG